MGLPMVRSDETDILTGKEAQRVLGEILESERKSRSLTYPAHTGAVGFFYEKPKFVAFDNSSNDCWVEEFKTETGARKWCRGQLSTDEVNALGLDFCLIVLRRCLLFGQDSHCYATVQ